MTEIVRTIVLLLALASGRMAIAGDSLSPGLCAAMQRQATIRLNCQHLVYFHLPDAILLLPDQEPTDILIVELGIQAARGSDRLASYNPNIFRRYYRQLLTEARQRALVVVAMEIPGVPVSESHARALNAIIHEEAARAGVPVAHTWGPLRDCGERCLAGDNFHPNSAGYRLLAAELWQTLLSPSR